MWSLGFVLSCCLHGHRSLGAVTSGRGKPGGSQCPLKPSGVTHGPHWTRIRGKRVVTELGIRAWAPRGREVQLYHHVNSNKELWWQRGPWALGVWALIYLLNTDFWAGTCIKSISWCSFAFKEEKFNLSNLQILHEAGAGEPIFTLGSFWGLNGILGAVLMREHCACPRAVLDLL